jgi:hypothetical protein
MSPVRRHVTLLAAILLVLTACAPANERPVRGAVPGSPPPTPPGVPPTLVPSDALRQRGLASASPSPGVAEVQPSPSAAVAQPSPGVTPSPSPSVVAAPPIVRTIVPSADGHVPAGGAVTLSAVLVGRGADLESASLSADGADAGAQIDKRSPRDWTIHTTQKLTNGPHTVRVLVRDAGGLAGGFTWQIIVGEPDPQPGPAASPPPTP